MPQTNEQIERQSLEIGKWGNLLMAVAGVLAAFLSRSDALLVDGLYSGVNFVSAIVAAGISARVAEMLGQAKTEIIIAARPPFEP